jgi:hypothetical protein
MREQFGGAVSLFKVLIFWQRMQAMLFSTNESIMKTAIE